ncbi:MAG: hypothetical protein HQM03_14325 [Magnetococcales bacterium]|nr:hypothetical protein [Magnetococcales bacterium]
MNRRIDNLTHMTLTLFGSLVGIIVAFIGFILWDRRTMLKPLEERLSTMDRLLAALREMARDEPKLAAALRQFSLM